ncbi:retrotransposon protein, putative, ty1-copia subclass [Tanacetum coccineum]
MAKIQEVLPEESSSTDQPLEQLQNHDENNVFANVRRHSEQPESINDTYVLEKDDSNVTPDSSNICNNDNQVDQNAAECVDERDALANLIANLTLDTEENKTILKQLKKANASLTQELKECRTNLDETGRALGEATSCRDSCLIALQNKQNEFEKYKAFNDRTIDYDILQTKLNETLGLLALKDIEIKEGLKTKAYEISVLNQKHDELVKKSLLTKSQLEGYLKENTKVISDLKVKEDKDIDKMIEMDKQLKFLNEIVYTRNQSIQTIHMLAPKCASFALTRFSASLCVQMELQRTFDKDDARLKVKKRGFFEKQKLSGPKFVDCYKQLRIILSAEDKLNYLELPIPATPVPAIAEQKVPPQTLAAHAAWEYDSFMQNYNMHDMGKMVNELHAMLKLHKKTLPKRDASSLHAIRAGKVKKKKNKYKKPQLAARGNNKGKGKSKLAYAPNPNIPPPPKKEDTAKDSGFRRSRKLKLGALSLYIGNGQHAAVKAIRSYDLDGIFEIVLSDSNTNVSSMYAVSNKRAKLNLDSSLLWHCRLGHISKKHIEKLQHDGLLNSIDSKSFEKCVPCLSGKMARKPYSHQVERAKDLLGLIHTDVCGPFRIVSRQGASYFVTFTDDFSRYGYVYLLKHKHEVFETFKVFQKEVENQLGKTIKSLRSDRGGEYMSQEFLDHLKEHGIIAHRTPPYMPQHNGVSERRNRTLLDMVCSMMSQTTLPNSFWDYALEFAECILNMIPTKKVEKKPYELWYGQAPKLSYLKVRGCEALVK